MTRHRAVFAGINELVAEKNNPDSYFYTGGNQVVGVFGYSNAGNQKAKEQYATRSAKFLGEFFEKAQLPCSTSPTTDFGSIDIEATKAALNAGQKVLQITCPEFEPFIDAQVEADRLAEIPYGVLPNAATYAEGAGVLANVALCMAGRAQAVKELCAALQNGERAIAVTGLLDDSEDYKSSVGKDGRVENKVDDAALLAEAIIAGKIREPIEGVITEKQLEIIKNNKANILVVAHDEPNSVKKAVNFVNGLDEFGNKIAGPAVTSVAAAPTMHGAQF